MFEIQFNINDQKINTIDSKHRDTIISVMRTEN